MSVMCRKCGLTATSKCPKQRNVFPRELDSATGQLIADDPRIRTNGDGSITVTVASVEDLIAVTSRIAATHEVNLKQALCNHEWAWVGPGDCLFGCCHADPVVTPTPLAEKDEGIAVGDVIDGQRVTAVVDVRKMWRDTCEKVGADPRTGKVPTCEGDGKLLDAPETDPTTAPKGWDHV